MTKHFLSVEEVSILTGFSKQFFYSEVYKSKIFGQGIPFHKFGPRTIRFVPEEVYQWLEDRSQNFRSLKEAVELSKATKTSFFQEA